MEDVLGASELGLGSALHFGWGLVWTRRSWRGTGGDPRPRLCIGRESLNASRAGMDWKTSSLAGGSAGHPQVPWQGRHGWGHPCARARRPLPAASTSPGRFPDRCSCGPAPATPSRQHPSSSSSSFQTFPPIEHLSWKPTSKIFFFFKLEMLSVFASSPSPPPFLQPTNST